MYFGANARTHHYPDERTASMTVGWEGTHLKRACMYVKPALCCSSDFELGTAQGEW
jgi:hypothetical protein